MVEKILKNKKAMELTLGTLVRIIIVLAIFFLILLPACNKFLGFFSNDRKYIASFEDFVNGVNGMTIEQKQFSLRLKKESAIIGFSDGSKPWECENCGPARSYEKPTNLKCEGLSCICLCNEGFEFDEDNKGKCKSLLCKTVEKDITARMELPGGKFWNNGFLFANDIDKANGLSTFKGNDLALFVDNKDGRTGICNFEMLKDNPSYPGSKNCIAR